VSANRPKYGEAARSLLRETLLGAATDLLREYRWSEVSMAAIAEHAGVSRQTLYNEFGSRDEFAQSYVMHQANAFLASVEASIAANGDDPRKALGAAFEAFLTAAEGNRMVRAILVRDPGADDLFALFTTRGGPVIQLATDRVAHAICKQWPTADETEVRFAAECLVRLAISHASLATDTKERTAASIASLLGPLVLSTLRLPPPVEPSRKRG
jgi:AcrR family transcriptional regulator